MDENSVDKRDENNIKSTNELVERSNGIPAKKKLTKAERRSIQEAQRAAKIERIKSGLPKNFKPTTQIRIIEKPLQGESVKKKKNIKPIKKSISRVLHESIDDISKMSISNCKYIDTVSIPVNEKPQDVVSCDNETADETSESTPGCSLQSDSVNDHFKSTTRKITHLPVVQKAPLRIEEMRKMALFSHLSQYVRPFDINVNFNMLDSAITYEMIILGQKYADEKIRGSNARCVALLEALKTFVLNYETPADKALIRDMLVCLNPIVSFLNNCRPISIGMGNVIKYFKTEIAKIPYCNSDEEAKYLLVDKLNSFYKERVLRAHISICNIAQEQLNDGDTIMTFGHSSVIVNIIMLAIQKGKKINLIIVDSKPRYEGRQTLLKMSRVGVECTYIGINGISCMMNHVNKVLIGAHAVLINGAVMTRVGSAMVAVVAKTFNVPFLVCAESYKYSERAQTDSIVLNELCCPEEIISSSVSTDNLFTDWKKYTNVCMLNISYDVIQPSLISGLISEVGIINCHSVYTIARTKNHF